RGCEGMEPVAVEAFRRHASRGSLGLIEAGLPPGDPALAETRKQQLLDHYAKHLYDHTRPFKGVEQLLQKLDRRGIGWAIVTNKPEYLTLPLLRHVAGFASAGAVICGDTLDRSKPDPAPVKLACELLGVRCGEGLLVGDDERDIQAGAAAGTTTVFARYGYGAHVPPNADRHIDAPLDLLDLLVPDWE
ncbi:MAG: HAD-IA family hydrolase, partial [Xanthomonadales bacterium]|nr:HAD-IA family hydrolase [Xanthomonadales bacterium]